jgi:hypothetical protein
MSSRILRVVSKLTTYSLLIPSSSIAFNPFKSFTDTFVFAFISIPIDSLRTKSTSNFDDVLQK